MAHRRGAMLPVWGAYVVSFVALGAVAYQKWWEPVAAKLRHDTSVNEREAAQLNFEAARLNHDSAEISRANNVSMERMMDRLGIKVRPSYE